MQTAELVIYYKYGVKVLGGEGGFWVPWSVLFWGIYFIKTDSQPGRLHPKCVNLLQDVSYKQILAMYV